VTHFEIYDIDALLNGVFKEDSLRDMFDKRVHELRTTQTAIQKLINIERRTLNGILDGTQKRADFDKLRELATFLNISTDKLYRMHVSLMEKNFMHKDSPANKKKFITKHFELTVLKKAGFINSLYDFEEIENKIVSFFGLMFEKQIPASKEEVGRLPQKSKPPPLPYGHKNKELSLITD
jgi:HTH-type transcriptional regulator / antitoxin HigA